MRGISATSSVTGSGCGSGLAATGSGRFGFLRENGQTFVGKGVGGNLENVGVDFWLRDRGRFGCADFHERSGYHFRLGGGKSLFCEWHRNLGFAEIECFLVGLRRRAGKESRWQLRHDLLQRQRHGLVGNWRQRGSENGGRHRFDSDGKRDADAGHLQLGHHDVARQRHARVKVNTPPQFGTRASKDVIGHDSDQTAETDQDLGISDGLRRGLRWRRGRNGRWRRRRWCRHFRESCGWDGWFRYLRFDDCSRFCLLHNLLQIGVVKEFRQLVEFGSIDVQRGLILVRE